MTKADILPTPAGDITITPINHASLVLGFAGLTVYLDPVGSPDRYKDQPRPDLILLTHEHGDHFYPPTLEAIAMPQTEIVGARSAIEKLEGPLAARARILARGETTDFRGFTVTATPAENVSPEKLKFHPPGVGNGYLLAFGGQTVYVAGDTEDTAEMRALEGVDVAFLPMNQPYTMSGQQAADAVRAFRPRIVYPFHYMGGAENEIFATELSGESGIEVRQRDWYAE